METTTFDIDFYINIKGCVECVNHGYLKSRFDQFLKPRTLIDEDGYYNILISLTEYSFDAFNETEWSNMFNYDYDNNIELVDMSNPIIKSPVFEHYCNECSSHEGCPDCWERYRVITRHMIPVMKNHRKDLCSIYFIDLLYQLVRFEYRDVYTLIVYVFNQFSDGSSFKAFANEFGRKRICKILKRINVPFRRCDFKLILKKYLPLIYRLYAYCANTQTDCLDKVYDYMLYNGMSMFKSVPSDYVVVGYTVGTDYRIDIIKTDAIMNMYPDMKFKIASHPLVEELNFGFYEERMKAYKDMCKLDNKMKNQLRNKFKGVAFSGVSVFTGKTIYSNDCIVIGFLKASENTFQNFRLDIHIPSFIDNDRLKKMRTIAHDKWRFEDNTYDVCYV